MSKGNILDALYQKYIEMNFTCFILPFFNVSTRDLKLHV